MTTAAKNADNRDQRAGPCDYFPVDVKACFVFVLTTVFLDKVQFNLIIFNCGACEAHGNNLHRCFVTSLKLKLSETEG